MEPKQHTPDDVIIKIDDVKKWIYALLGVGCILIGIIWNWMRDENNDRKVEIKAIAANDNKQDLVLGALNSSMKNVEDKLREARDSSIAMQQSQQTIILQLSEARLTLGSVAARVESLAQQATQPK